MAMRSSRKNLAYCSLKTPDMRWKGSRAQFSCKITLDSASMLMASKGPVQACKQAPQVQRQGGWKMPQSSFTSLRYRDSRLSFALRWLEHQTICTRELPDGRGVIPAFSSEGRSPRK